MMTSHAKIIDDNNIKQDKRMHRNKSCIYLRASIGLALRT